MATNFPTSLDSLTNPTSTDSLTSPSHAGQHADANDAIEALQAKVGVNSSVVTTSLDYKVEKILAVSQSNRNIITNGAMRVAQRGTSTSFGSGGGTNYFGADRFLTDNYTWTAGSNITISQQSGGPTGFNNFYRIATGATGLTFGSGGYLRIGHRIEGYAIAPYHSKTMTLSFWVRSSVTGTYNLFLENGWWGAGTTTRAYAPEFTINAANTWEKKTIAVDMSSATSSGTWNTTTGIGLAISWQLGAHSDRTGNSYKSGWTTYSSIHIQTSTGTQWATNANATFDLTGVQLEDGAVATPFEFEDYGVTLAKCQRYHQVTKGNIYTGGSTGLSVPIPYFTEMRGTPTAALSGGSASNVSTELVENLTSNGARYTLVPSASGSYYLDRTIALSAEL